MKKIVAAIAFFVTLSAQAATVNLPITCLSLKELEKVLKQFKEEILFFGLDDIHGVQDLTVNIFMNKETRTYSIVVISPSTETVCVVSSGVNGKLVHNQ